MPSAKNTKTRKPVKKVQKKVQKKIKTPHLYHLYEESVQSPDIHINWLVKMYHSLTGKYAVHLREDFCGTFAMSCAWVQKNRNNTAIGLDLDSHPINYGKKVHLSKLTPEQKKRIRIFRKNAISVTKPKADIIMVGNFSFFIFKKKETLVNYLKKCRQSLRPQGVTFLEMAGGPGMITKIREKRLIRPDSDISNFHYTWDQQHFDPITHDAVYAIHFALRGGKKIENAFVYDWRLWTIPEVREAFEAAGYSKSIVYWETIHKGEGTGEFVPAENGDNAYSWIAYVVGVR